MKSSATPFLQAADRFDQRAANARSSYAQAAWSITADVFREVAAEQQHAELPEPGTPDPAAE